MIRKFFQGVLFMLLLIVLAVIGYGVWVYRQSGTLPFTIPGVARPTPLTTSTAAALPTPTPTPITQSAVVANTYLPAGTLLTTDMLTETQLPVSTLPSDVAASSAQVIGKVLSEPVEAGQPIRLSNVVSPGHVIGKGSEFAQMLQPGEVAIAYPVQRANSAAYAPRAGDLVDLIVTFLIADVDVNFQSRLSNKVLVLSQDLESGTYAFRPAGTLGRVLEDGFLAVPIYVVPSQDQRPRMVAQLTIQNARVLYFGTSLLAPTPVPGEKPYPPDLAVLAVSPQDAVMLNFFMARHAETTMVLRSALETTPQPEATIVPVTLNYIQEHYGVPLPAKQPYQINPSSLTPTPKP